MTGAGGEVAPDADNATERRTLIRVLAINLSQALLAGIAGLLAQSTGLLGAAVDNLCDAAVYIVSIYAVGRPVAAKVRVARLSGVLLIVLALALLVEVARRFLTGSDPVGWAMITVAAVNSATNLLCLRLLRDYRERGVHLKASWIFTANDMIANVGIVVSGIAVMVLRSPLPDLLIGVAVAGIVLKGSWEILRGAREAAAQTTAS